MNSHTISWLTLKNRWLSAYRGECNSWQAGIGRKLTADRNAGWTGATAEQTTQWVTDGYDLPGYSAGSVDFSPRKRRRAVWAEEEGMIDRTRLRCGAENYRLHRSKRDARRGAKVEIGYGFRAGVTAQTIGQYGKVCAGIIRKLEAEGLDVEVDIVSRSRSYIQGVREQCELRVNVKKINERSDFRSWSALFSPTGHRHLIFMGRAIHADEQGKQCSWSMGGSEHRGYTIERDGDTIKINCSSFSNEDPTTTLTEQAKACGIL